jgi:hypothetical protein
MPDHSHVRTSQCYTNDMPREDISPVTASKARRPRRVSILASIQFFQGLALIINGSMLIVIYGWPGIKPVAVNDSSMFLLFEQLTSGVSQIFLALPILIVSIALLKLRSWAWLFAMSLQGLGLILSLYAYAIHRPNYAVMLLGIILVFYLNQQEVQIAFREPRG